MRFDSILFGFRPKQIAVGLAAMLALGAFQFDSKTANADPLTNASGLPTPVTVVTFDGGPADGVLVTDQFSADGVEFGSLTASEGLYMCSTGHPGRCIQNYFPDTYNPFSIKFSSPVTEAAFEMITNGSTDTFTALLNGVIVESFGVGTGGWQFYGFTNIEFDEIQVLIGAITSGSHMRLDNLQIGPPAAPSLGCEGFMPPFDQALSLKKKVKRAIPIKLELFDADGYIVTDQDIVAPPVINVSFEGQVFGEVPPDSDDLLPLGSANDDNILRYESTSQQWIYNLGTKQFIATGTYTVEVVSGDELEYTIATSDNVACSQTFERLN